MNPNVAYGIKRTILDKGLVQKTVAERAGFSCQQFSDMLRGRKTIKAEYMPQIAFALGVEVGDIYAAGYMPTKKAVRSDHPDRQT